MSPIVSHSGKRRNNSPTKSIRFFGLLQQFQISLGVRALLLSWSIIFVNSQQSHSKCNKRIDWSISDACQEIKRTGANKKYLAKFNEFYRNIHCKSFPYAKPRPFRRKQKNRAAVHLRRRYMCCSSPPNTMINIWGSFAFVYFPILLLLSYDNYVRSETSPP